jgi:hypothetical protein
MSKRNLYRIAEAIHQTQVDHLQEIRRKIWEIHQWVEWIQDDENDPIE